MSRLDAAKRWAHAAKSHYERDLHRVGITGLHKAAMGDVLEGVAHVTELVARVEELAGALRMAHGAYDALAISGIADELPGFDRCQAKLKAALAALEAGDEQGRTQNP